MGCCDGTDDIDDDNEVDDNGGEQQNLLQNQIPLNLNIVVNVPLPEVYYVIIGRGPMAVVNHRTLLESQSGLNRLGVLPVMHVGFPNPWPRYLRHGLGQPNHLLSFPGFRHQPSQNGAMIDGGLDSQHFGAQVQAEFDLLPVAEVAAEWVALIQREDAPGAIDVAIANQIGGQTVTNAINAILNDAWPDDLFGAPYRLCLYNPATGIARWVYAGMIDICTGPGRPSVDRPAGGDTDEIRAARTPPWLPPEGWSPAWLGRRVMNGVDAIRDEVQWQADERICVTAGGGVGLNAAEKARNQRCTLDWFGRTQLMPIFENPRNITFLKHPDTGEPCAQGSRQAAGINAENDLIASSRSIRMGRGAVLTSATIDQGSVVVTLQTYGNTNLIRDFWENRSNFNVNGGRWEVSHPYTIETGRIESRLYDRLVVPNGQDTEQPGHPPSFAHHLGFQAVVALERMVALETADHRVRVLGAACNNYRPFDQGTWNTANRPNDTPAARMWHYHRSLPVSAVPDGFIICSTNTALANGYFTDHANLNVNTMTRAEIDAVVGDANLGALIFNGRHARNGYQILADLQAVCNSQDGRLARLEFEYRVR
jgi:hypothetical protein